MATSDDSKNDYRVSRGFGNFSDDLELTDSKMAALACLWLASKAEETPKKSKEILCAAWNLPLPTDDHLTPDDEVVSLFFISRTKLTKSNRGSRISRKQ